MSNLENTELMTELTAEIVSAYVSNNPISASELPNLITSTFKCVSSLNPESETEEATIRKPAVPIKKSITDEYLICLENGQKFKSLKRHLMAHHGLTPKEYRKRWGLSSDYPMVAPAYAKRRSNLAKEIGLGRKASEG